MVLEAKPLFGLDVNACRTSTKDELNRCKRHIFIVNIVSQICKMSFRQEFGNTLARYEQTQFN